MPLKSFSPFNDIVISWAGVLASQASVTLFTRNKLTLNQYSTDLYILRISESTINKSQQNKITGT